VVQFNIFVIFAHEAVIFTKNVGHSWLKVRKSCRVWALLSSMGFHTKVLINMVINVINCTRDRLHLCNR
jgi:hypothetical protein